MSDIHKDEIKQIEMRDARPEDVRSITDLLYKTWLETYPNEEAGITREDVEDIYKDSFKEETIKEREENTRNYPKNQRRVVATFNNQVVGVTSMVRNEDNNQLKTIYVLPEFQGKGIGTMLWNEVIKFVDPTKDIIVQVATYNTKTIEFYKKLGFVDNGKRFTDEKFRFKSGAIIPEMEMEIKVGSGK